MLGKVSSSMMGTFGALLEIILILYPSNSQTVKAIVACPYFYIHRFSRNDNCIALACSRLSDSWDGTKFERERENKTRGNWGKAGSSLPSPQAFIALVFSIRAFPAWNRLYCLCWESVPQNLIGTVKKKKQTNKQNKTKETNKVKFLIAFTSFFIHLKFTLTCYKTEGEICK